MGTYYRRTNEHFASIGTTRTITVPTSPTTQITLTSGNHSLELINLGPGTIAYGDSSISMSSAGLLFYSMNKMFTPVISGFSCYVIADSVATIIAVNEYRA